jgi:hypothetical protein
MTDRAGRGAALAAGALALLALAAAFLRDWHLPGLYMDAINPEYLISGILHPPPPYDLAIPGNRIGYYPVFTGTVYHGSTQLYAALPFLAVFGDTLTTFRMVQLLVGAGITVLVLMLAGAGALGPRRVVAVAAAGLVAIDPAFVLSLRTQSYSCLFPLLLLLGSVLLLPGAGASRLRTLRVALSGVLFGLAVFSYFIFGLFVLALLWLLWRAVVARPDGRVRTVAAWLAGCAVGYAPFVLGLLLLRHEVGGTSALFDWLDANREQLHVGGDDTGILARLRTITHDAWTVLTGDWPWEMILRERRDGVLETLKAWALLGLPAIAVAYALWRRSRRAEAAGLAVPVALLVSYAVGALVFGNRLDGHHYTPLLPVLYAAFGCACALLWPGSEGRWRPALGSPARALRAAAVGAAVLVVGVTSVVSQQRFHERLIATGGVGRYTDAIDALARDVDRYTPRAIVHSPDWGFQLPLAFLSSASIILDKVDVSAIRRESCAGVPQVVVFLGAENAARLRLVAALAGRPMRMRTWTQHDGVPVFQTGVFGTATRCVTPPAPAASRKPQLTVYPAQLPACGFLGATFPARVTWAAPLGAGPVQVVAQVPGQPEALVAEGEPAGVKELQPYVTPGARFVMRAQKSGREVTSVAVDGAPCPVA